MDEFEELYRKSPAAKILYEKSGLFPNKSISVCPSERNGSIYVPKPSYPQQSVSLLEFEKPTVLLKKLTPRTWHQYKRTPFLSPKAKFIQSIKESLVVEEFRGPTKVVKVLRKKTDDRLGQLGDANGAMTSPVTSKEIQENNRMRNHVTSKRVQENERIMSQNSHNNSISRILSANRKSVRILNKERQNTNGIEKLLQSWEINESTESLDQVDGSNQTFSPSTNSVLDESVAKDSVASDTRDRSEITPTAENSTQKESNAKTDAASKRNDTLTPVSSQCESGSNLENENFSNGLSRNLFQGSESTADEDSNPAASWDNTMRKEVVKDSTQVKVDETKKSQQNTTVPAEKSESVCENKAEMSTLKTDKCTVLRRWSLRAAGHKRGIYVEGHRPGDADGDYWHSSAIVKRITSRQLETGSGSRYRLNGNIDLKMSLEYGFSKSLVVKFKYGFPKNWKELMQEELDSKCAGSEKCNSLAEHKTDGKSRKSRLNCRPLTETPANEGSSDDVTPVQSKTRGKSRTPVLARPPLNDGSSDDVTPVQSKTRGKSRTPVVARPPLNDGSLTETPVIERSSDDVTPVNLSRGKRQPYKKPSSTESSRSQSPLSLKDLPCSSRGRLIKPPLAYWTGQRLRNMSVDMVEIVPGTSNLIGVNDSPTSLGLHEQVQVNHRDVRSMRRNNKSKISKKTRKGKDSSDLESPSVDSDAGSASSAPDSGAISKIQSRQLKKSMNRKDARSRLIVDTGESSQPGEGGTDESERTELAACEPNDEKDGLRRHDDKARHHHVFKAPGLSNVCDITVETTSTNNSWTLEKPKSIPILETPRCSRSTTNANKVDKNNSINMPSVTECDKAEDSVMQSAGSKSTRAKSKSKIVDKNNATNQQPSFSNSELSCEEADDERSDSDQRKGRKRRTSLRKQALLAKVDPVSNIQSSKENVSKKQGGINSKCETLDHETVGVQEWNNGHIDVAKSIGSQSKRNRRKTVGNGKKESTVSISNNDSVHKAMTKPKKKEKQLAIEDSVGNGVWQPKEINNLQRAIKTVAPSAARFWHKIAASVGTKTATECQQKYQVLADTPVVNKRNEKRTEANKDKGPVMLTAKHGTMKRKRQLRQLVEQYDEDYEDDLFDMLDNQTSKKPKIPDDLVTDEDDGLTLNLCKFQTPTVRPLTRIPMSTQKTPQLSLLSPGMFHSVDRKKIDPYIHRLQGNRGRVVRPAKAKETKRRKSINALHQFLNGHGTNIFDVTALSDVDSDEEKDHYWSDEEFQ